MEKISFKRIQVVGMFIISFLGGMVHMSLHSIFGEGLLFGWAESLLNALKTEGATLSSVAATAKVPELEIMSCGMLYVAVL